MSFPKICYNYKKCHNLTISDVSLYHLGDDSTSIGGEKQACISGGVNPPADIASGRAHIVRWTMVLRRPKRSVDLQSDGRDAVVVRDDEFMFTDIL